MVDIISKKDGPRREDVQAKRMIAENRQVIHKLADQISGGGYSAMQARKAQKPPQASGLILHDLGAGTPITDPEPYVRVSLNNRVVLADMNSGKQMQLLGEIRGGFGNKSFVLATKDNGFISPVSDDLFDVLKDLDGRPITRDFSDKALAETISDALGLG